MLIELGVMYSTEYDFVCLHEYLLFYMQAFYHPIHFGEHF